MATRLFIDISSSHSIFNRFSDTGFISMMTPSDVRAWIDTALGIVCRAISSYLTKKAGFTQKTAQIGAVTLIQRFGGALNLNVHLHMLFLDGVYTTTPWGKSRFHRANALDRQELMELVPKPRVNLTRFHGVLFRASCPPPFGPA